MFMKLKLYLIMAVAIAVFAAGAYWYYRDTQAALQAYAANAAVLETSLELQKQTTLSLQQDIEQMRKVLGILNTEFTSSRTQVADLTKRFNQTKSGADRDLGVLAAEKPALIQKSVNTGTQEVFRCLELLSGAAPTQGEKDDQKYNACISSAGPVSMQ